ncbi:MAG: hypothetical protein ABH843_03270 [Candidatus Omnitrophota bacterium]
MKRIITFLITVALVAQSSAPSYALRPASTANSDKLPDENKKIIIDTKELGLKAKQQITVSDMLERFSKKHPDILADPLSVLVVMRQQDARLTFKTDFNNQRECPVKVGETYQVAYMHRRLILNKNLPLPRGIWVCLGGLTPKEKGMFEKLLEAVGKLLKRDASYTYARLLTEKWIEKEESEGISKLEFTKKLLVYYYKEFKYKLRRYEDDVTGLYYLLATLMEDKDVESFISQLVKAYYAQGDDAITERDSYGGEKVYIDDFDFLLSLLVEQDDSDIRSIAIHAVMDTAGFEKSYSDTFMDIHEGKLPLFAQGMIHSNRISFNRAIILRLLQNEHSEKLFTRSSAVAKSGFLKDPFMRALVREMFRYDTFSKKKDENGIMAFGQHYTLDRLARIIEKIGEPAVFDFMDMVLEEKDRDVVEKMAYFLDRLAWLFYVTGKDKSLRDSIISKELSEEFCQKWVDMIIYLAKKHKIILRQTKYVKGIIEDVLDYKRGRLKNALVFSLLEDDKRDDIWFILDILELYKFEETREIVIKKYLKKDSPHLKAAIRYLYRHKSAKDFDDVWRFLSELESTTKKIDNALLAGIGRYFVAMLELRDEEGLKSEQKDKIRCFTERHILNQNMTVLLKSLKDEKYSGDLSPESLPDESIDYTDRIYFIRVWLLLAGYFNKDDRSAEIMQASERSLKFQNILDVSLQALLSLNSDETYGYLRDFAISILLDEKESHDNLVDPAGGLIEPKETVCNMLQKNIAGADPARRRKLFIDMIDIAILNQSRKVFDTLLHAFISTDPKGALDTLRSGKWADVDLSNIDPDPLDMPDISGVGDKIYDLKGLRDFFMSRYFNYIKNEEHVGDLKLVDNEEAFWEKVRFGIRVLLLIELGLIGDEEKREEAKLEFLIDSAFKHSGFSTIMRTEERLSALVALKPVVDITNFDLKMPKLKSNYTIFLWENLLARDPIFYKPLEKEMKAYIRWLIKNQIVTSDYKTSLDRFGAYFLKKSPTKYNNLKLCSFDKAEEKMEKFEKFLRVNIIQFFYPEEKKCENYYQFTRQFMYTLVSLFSRLEQERKDSSVDAKPGIWPMFLLPPDLLVIKVEREGYVEPVSSILKDVSKYIKLLPGSTSGKLIKAIDSAA